MGMLSIGWGTSTSNSEKVQRICEIINNGNTSRKYKESDYITIAELATLVTHTSDISEVCGMQAMKAIKMIVKAINDDHYDCKDVFDEDFRMIDALYAIDVLMAHWKGIMIYSSL